MDLSSSLSALAAWTFPARWAPGWERKIRTSTSRIQSPASYLWTSPEWYRRQESNPSLRQVASDPLPPDAPARVRWYGSPTILVDRKDVAGALPAEGGACCRLCEHDDTGLCGGPSLGLIVAALEASADTDGSLLADSGGGGWKKFSTYATWWRISSFGPAIRS